MPVNNIFVVVCQSRDEGMEVNAFRTEEAARKYISADVQETQTNLIKGGYKPFTNFRGSSYANITVTEETVCHLTAINETIWYEWRISRTKLS